MPANPSPADARDSGVRLQKLLAAAGVESRRKCEEFIVAGRVTIDGEVVTDLGRKVDPEHEDVRLDGERLRPQKRRYYLLNKPAGYICTNYDRAGRPKAVDLVPTHDVRLFTVGRLDEASEGLLLVTNDGDLAQQLAHPRYQVPRVYRVQVAGVPSAESLAELRKGIHFADGRFGVKRTKRLKTHGRSAFLEVELTQGQNREIRRLFARIGHKVIWLQRVAFGPLKLGDLSPGRFRPLRTEEIKALHQFVRAAARPAMRARPAKRPTRTTASRGSTTGGTGERRILDLSGGESQPADRKPAKKKPATKKPARKSSPSTKASKPKSTVAKGAAKPRKPRGR